MINILLLSSAMLGKAWENVS
ncbi:hypothetical protein D030_3339A, partial [Vibrio parahaemolyticus AQ3810]